MAARSLSLALACALLVGCASKDDPTTPDDTGGAATEEDADQDGFVASDDCDDTNAAVNPDAPELCNGIDDDCDARVDADPVDAPTWYRDSDGDGYGNDSTVTCDAPVGSVTVGGDCDDTQPAVYPGAAETCNDRDDDCDGEIDNGAIPTWYLDDDGDGYGDPAFPSEGCEAPVRYVAEGTDCNDANASVSPGATEVCDARNVDEDCDGLADDLDSVTGTSAWYQDADGDGHGDETVTRLACDAPTGFVSAGDDCDDADAALSPDAVELCDGRANDCATTGSWTAADELDLVSWTDAAGVTSDVTSTFAAGTAGAPATWTAPGDGDLNFCGGTWYANLAASGVAVTVTGSLGAEETVLDGGGAGRVVTLEGGTLWIDALTIQGGYSSDNGGGIHCSGATFLGKEIVVTDNESAAYGGGIVLDACVDAELVDSEVSDNRALVAGGLYATDSNGLVLSGLLVDGNAGTRGGAGLYLDTSTFTLSDSTVSNNATDPSYSPGGLMAYYSDGAIDTVAFTENVSNYGGGVEVLTATVDIANSTFTSNTGGALYGYVGSTVDVSDSVFSGNSSASQGVIHLDNSVTTSFTDCSFTDNTGIISGAFSFSRSSSATFVNATFAGNSPYDAYAASTGYTLGTVDTLTCDTTSGCY